MGTYSVNNIKLNKYQLQTASASISGTYTQSLDYMNKASGENRGGRIYTMMLDENGIPKVWI